jgi:hypothetical protein
LLFPELGALAILEMGMKELVIERSGISMPKVISINPIFEQWLTSTWKQKSNIIGLNGINSNVVRANQLRLQVLDFEREQLLRVKDIQAREADALAKVKEAKNGKAAYIVKVGMMLPVSNISQNWEVDTNCGEQETKHDEFDKGKRNRSAVLFWCQTNTLSDISRQELKLADLKGRFRFERLLNSKLKDVMETFAVDAKLQGHEAALWLQETENDKLFKLGEDERRASNNQAFLWMRDTIYAADVNGAREEMETQDLYGNDGVDGSASAIHTSEILSSHDDGIASAAAAFIANPFDNEVVDDYCEHCKRGGHGDRFAEPKHKVPTVCFYCGRFGHVEECCFDLHPELLEEYRNNRPFPFCTGCDKKGHWRKYCKSEHN